MRRRWLSAGLIVMIAALLVAERSLTHAQQNGPPTAATAPPVAGGRVVPDSRDQITLSYAPVVRQTAPAVVNVFTERVVADRQDAMFQRMFPGMPFGPQIRGRTRERVERSLGSGVIVETEGMIVTNAHVVSDADQIRVVLHDRREFPAETLLVDERADLAVLRIDAPDDLPTLPLGSSEDLEVGDLVLAIGNPFGVGQTVTSGIVSARARNALGIQDVDFFLQTDAAINPGNSGGALVDMRGQLVGINTAIFSQSGGSLGIGFAIPVEILRGVIAAAENGGRLQRPWLGGDLAEIDTDRAVRLDLDRPQGALVVSVYEGGVLAQADLQSGDVILSFNGRPVDVPSDLTFRLSTGQIGDQVALEVLRDGERLTRQVTLAPPPGDTTQTAVIDTPTPMGGLELAAITPALAVQIGYEGRPEGVIVTGVRDRSPAARFGFHPGDLLVVVNGNDIHSLQDAIDAANAQTRAWEITISRDGQIIRQILHF